MRTRPDDHCESFREVRKNLAEICHRNDATVVLSFGHPIAIITPIDAKGLNHVGPKERPFAAAKKKFLAALEHLRTH